MIDKRKNGNNTALLLCFILGVIGIRFQSFILSTEVNFFALVLLLVLILISKRNIGDKPIKEMGQYLIFFLTGITWASLIAANVITNQLPAALEQQKLTVSGRIISPIEPTGEGIRFNFKIESITHSDQPIKNQPSPGIVRLTYYAPDFQPKPFERYQFTVKLKRPHGLQNPGSSFNYETWLFQNRIRATGYITQDTITPLPNHPTLITTLQQSTQSLREDYATTIQQQTKNTTAANILIALTVGLRDQLEDDQWQVLQNTGTTHLIAISGLHIGFFSFLAGWLGIRLWRCSPKLCARIPDFTAGAIIGLIAGLSYAILAGFTLPTRRALCMLVIIVLAILIKRRIKPLVLLTTVLAITLLIDPLAPFSVSFWLSFSAVAVLIIISSQHHYRNHKDDNKIFSKFKNLSHRWVFIQVWLLLGLIPITLIGFQQFSLIAPLANLIAIPIIGLLVVPLGLLGLITHLLGFTTLTNILIKISETLIATTWQFLDWLSTLPIAIWQQGLPPWWTIPLAILGITLLMIKISPAKWLGLVFLVPMLFLHPTPPAQGEFKLTQLDVGQGLATIIQTQNHTLIYDTGAAYPSGFNLAQTAIIPYLRHQGINQIDQLIISHADNDHAGGAEILIKNLTINKILTGEHNHSDLPAPNNPCYTGQTWQWDNVTFEIIWPDIDHIKTGNNASCVLKITSPNGTALLTGDIEKRAEKMLVERHGKALEVDLLQTPHHGSITSSSTKFLSTTSPKLALISAGYLNRYKHPHPNILNRYQSQSIPTLNNADQGAIILHFSNNGITLNTQRNESPAFWISPAKTDLTVIRKQLNSAL